MFRVTPESLPMLPLPLRSEFAASASVASQVVVSKSRSGAGPVARSNIIPFPVASASEDGQWQSLGQAAASVMRSLRPMKEAV